MNARPEWHEEIDPDLRPQPGCYILEAEIGGRKWRLSVVSETTGRGGSPRRKRLHLPKHDAEWIAASLSSLYGGAWRPVAEPEPAGESRRGRPGKFAGKHIRPMIAENGYQPGGYRHRSLEIVLAAGNEGIPFENYEEQGGRREELGWHLNRGNVELE